jgi:DNA-binding transcriptional LysR family regulator
VEVPAEHPLASCQELQPQQLSQEPQVVFDYDMENSFSQWAVGTAEDGLIVGTVNTAQAALELVSAGVGVCVMATECIQNRPDVRFIPLRNWHQALYMCILYDKWLEPPIWELVEQLVRAARQQG